MSLMLLGLNHRTAPVDVREKLAFSREGAANAIALFRRLYPQAEASIVSTCNRVEILVNAEGNSPGLDDVVSFLAQARDLPVTSFRPHLYELEDRAAVKHLLRVISGLDSMVIGESQIVNQMKQAYGLSHEKGAAGPVLHRLFHHAFGVSKRLRSETGIGDGKLSVSSVAVDIVREVCPDPSSATVLMVGAGEMAQYACEYLAEASVKRLLIATRTLTNAKTLADTCGGTAVPYAELDQHLLEADIVITATSCPTAILTVERINAAMARRHNRRLLLVDLAVPRNIEPAVGLIHGVSLYDIDALGEVVANNQKSRLAAVEACERVIDEEVEAFEQWINESRVRPIIDQMFRDVRELANIEVRRLFNKCSDLTEQQRGQVSELVDRLVGKFLHPCVATIRQGAAEMSSATLAEAFHSMRLSFEAKSGQVECRGALSR